MAKATLVRKGLPAKWVWAVLAAAVVIAGAAFTVMGSIAFDLADANKDFGPLIWGLAVAGISMIGVFFLMLLRVSNILIRRQRDSIFTTHLK